jgi:hypothetical protein
MLESLNTGKIKNREDRMKDQTSLDRMDRINKMVGFNVPEHNYPDDPVRMLPSSC